MARITDIAATFDAGVTLTADEVWQCQSGIVELSTDASPAAGDGIRLRQGEGVRFSSGLTVKRRRVETTAAVITRNVV